MLKRIITGVVGLPLIIAIGYYGGILLQVSLLILALIGLSRLVKILNKII